MSNAAGRVKKQVKRAIWAATQHAETDTDESGKLADHIDVARRANIKIAMNVGEPNATTEASAIQVAPIRQTGGETSVEGTDCDGSME